MATEGAQAKIGAPHLDEGAQASRSTGVERYKDLIRERNPYAKFLRYLRTRRAILEGEKLFDLSAEELRARNFMGPLALNVYETTLAGIPAAGIAWVISNRLHVGSTNVVPQVGSTFWDAALAQWYAFFPIVRHAVTAFVVPATLMVLAIGVSWSCLHGSDSRPEIRRRCRNAFLYFDGTYGLFPQMVSSIVLVIQGNSDRIGQWLGDDLSSVLSLLGWFPGAVVCSWPCYVLFVQIPRLLFELNAYGEPQGIMCTTAFRPRPWAKFICGTTIAGLVVVPLVAIVLAVAIAIGFLALAALKVWFLTLL